MTQLVPVPLNYGHILQLAPKLQASDLADLTLHEGDPEGALISGLSSGEAYAVLDGDTVIGAGGWTVEGAVWSLWADLSKGQAKELLRWAARWARVIAIRSKRPLGNVYRSGNHKTARWLKLTKCVTILDDHPIMWNGQTYIPFHLKPLEDLPYV